MEAAETVLLMTGYLVFAGIAFSWSAARARTAVTTVLPLIVTLICAAAFSWLAILVGQNGIVSLLTVAFHDREPRLLVAFIGGGMLAAPLLLLGTTNSALSTGCKQHRLTKLLMGMAASAGIVCGAASMSALVWDDTFDIQLARATTAPGSGMVATEIAKLEQPPVRVAAGPPGTVFVASYTVDTMGRYNGQIIKCTADSASGRYFQDVVASSYILYRPYGLAFRDGDLFVSRCGQMTRADDGRITNVPCGTITQLKDLDGDGYFEYYNDVATDLPGASGPDPMHQNNGIAFDAAGNLYVELGANADRDLDDNPLAGTVLRYDQLKSPPTIVASGFRNPFGIAVNSDGAVFVTDNDTADNSGDELNHVIQGEHYGHPFIVPGEPLKTGVGFREPILVSDKHSNFGGLAFASSKLLPKNLQNSLLLCDMGGNRLLNVHLQRKGESFSVIDTAPLASILSPVDVAVGDDGCVYVASYYYKKIYVLRPSQSPPIDSKPSNGSK